MDRSKLPYRRNCEGYFLCSNGEVVVRDTGKGYLEFPGGGVDEGEDPGKALMREAYEEAGVILDGELKSAGVIHFIWGPEWAKTDKQKSRYEKFKGEEMDLFYGKVKELHPPKGDSNESGWHGNVTMDIDEAIKFIESQKPFPSDLREYRETQLNALRLLKDLKK